MKYSISRSEINEWEFDIVGNSITTATIKAKEKLADIGSKGFNIFGQWYLYSVDDSFMPNIRKFKKQITVKSEYDFKTTKNKI